MKKIIITFLLGMILLSSHAQAPQAFQYQAIARDIEGNVLANQDVSFKIVILKESINGTAVYRETHDTITNALGLVTLAIGNGTVITGVFENINWGDGLYFLKILMDENGGANYQLMGITQLLSVPYSLYSASSGDAGATQINDLTDAKTAGNNVYLGLGAGVDDDSTNNQNVGVGRIALNANTSGYYNTAIGNYSLFTNTVGHHNTSAGHNSLYNNTAGNNNTALGNAANLFNEEGSNNTIIGFQAGRGTSAHNKFGNVFLGYRAGYNDTTDNKLYIENSGSSTPLIWGDFEDNILAFNANVGIGTNNPYAKLDVRGNSPDDGAIIRTGNSDGSHRLSFFPGRENDPNPFIQWKEGDPFRFSTDEGGWSEKMRISGNGNIGIGTTDPSEMLEVAGSIYSSAGGFKFPDGTVQATAAAGGATGNTLDQAYDQGGWGAGRTIIADNGAVNIQGSGGLTVNGNIGIGTIAPAYPLSIQPGTSTMGLYIDHNQTDAGNTHGLLIDLDKTYTGDSKIYGGTLWITNNNGTGDTWGLYSSASGTSSGIKYGVYGKASGSGTLWAGYFAGGNVHIANQLGIGTTAPSTNLVVKSSGYAHGVHVLANDDEYIFRVRQMSGGGGGIYLYDSSENSTILLNGEGDCWINSGRLGIGTATPASRLDVQGNVTIRDISTGEIAIELGKGLDYAEGFNVTNKTNIEPGTILCIDPVNPGKLKISENAYDKTVAGIVAGANGLGSGVRLGTQEFDCDVALAGRVYCNTIATTENIEPGDMLTTSSIPGFAMKVTDFENAHGAILGKAMESLEKGKKGQILVLVTLH